MEGTADVVEWLVVTGTGRCELCTVFLGALKLLVLVLTLVPAAGSLLAVCGPVVFEF